MRPGRNAPDNFAYYMIRNAMVVASMRPGRNAPDNASVRAAAIAAQRFNEAGAKCPG